MTIDSGEKWFTWFVDAIGIVNRGVADRLQKGGITIYKKDKIIYIEMDTSITEDIQ